MGSFACSSDLNFLEGSIGNDLNLGFDYVEVMREEDSMVVEYLDEVSYPQASYQGTNTPVKLTVFLLPTEDQLDEELDVTDSVELDRYVIVLRDGHIIEQDTRQFPEVRDATVTFFWLSDEPVEAAGGEFSVVFVEGSTLRGGFNP
jgi:hypothetical protein